MRYPDHWYTNTEIGDTPACSWFSPTLFETDASGSVPDEIAIEIHVRETCLGQIPEWPRVLQETVSIGGYEASRMEDAIPRPDGGFDFTYHYAAWLDEDATGLKVTAWTQSEGQPDYLLHKAVLDRIIGTLEFRDVDAEAEAAAKAESLFVEPDTCTNPDAGYTVAFPEAWYTNTEIGQTPACSWFTPDFFEVPDSGETPAEVWISIGLVDGVVGYTGLTETFISEELALDGTPAGASSSTPTPPPLNTAGITTWLIVGVSPAAQPSSPPRTRTGPTTICLRRLSSTGSWPASNSPTRYCAVHDPPHGS